jgi:hypothetical protein
VGAIAGTAAWIVGYALTALVVITRIEDSRLGEISGNLEGGESTVEFVGGDGFTPLLYVVPTALLVAAGVAVGPAASPTRSRVRSSARSSSCRI